MKKFREFLKGVITEDTYQPIEFPKELVEKYKSLQNLKGDEQTAAIAALSDEQKASLTEYGNEVAQHYRKYFKPWYEYEDDNRWYEKGMREYEGQRLKFRHLIKKINNSIVGEAVYTPSNQIGIPTTGNPKYTWIWTVKMFIYHNTRQYKNFFQTWAQEFQATWNSTIDKLKSSAGKPVNLAIAKDDRTIYIYPNAIFDKVDGTTLHFHLDPKKYREYKGFGYQVQTTNLQYWYNKNHQSSDPLNALQEDYGVDIAIKNGIKMEKVDFYWYKVYGKEKGQLSDFYVRAKNVMILEDLTAAWDKLISLYEQATKEQKEAKQKQQAVDKEINNRAKAIYGDASKKKEVKELYNTIKDKKSSEITSALEPLSIEQLKDIQAMAFYRYYNHYDLYATAHKTAEMADDYRWFSSQKAQLQGIRDRDHSILSYVGEVIDRKANEQ